MTPGSLMCDNFRSGINSLLLGHLILSSFLERIYCVIVMYSNANKLESRIKGLNCRKGTDCKARGRHMGTFRAYSQACERLKVSTIF